MTTPRSADRFQHPRFARAFIELGEEMDRRGARQHRQQLVAGLSGRVVEVGAGQGRNFAHYPPSVTDVLAVEPDDILRAAAERAAADAPVPVRVVAGHAEALPAEDGTLDAAVVSLMLCSVPDQAAALAEIRRVLRPGGELRYYEHVRSAHRGRGLLEDAITPLWKRLAGGCHPNRRTGQAVRRAGFVVREEVAFSFRPAPPSPASTHLLGRASRAS